MSNPAPFEEHFNEFKLGSPKLFNAPTDPCTCPMCLPGLELDIEERLRLAFSVGFNAGVMAQAMKDAKEKNR